MKELRKINSKADKKTTGRNARLLYLLIIIAYVAFHTFAIFKHELWRDEAMAWLIAKNTSVPQLFSLLSGEGHPALWFLFLRLFAKLGFPFQYISFLSLGLMTAALYLMLFKAPFPDIVKIFVSISAIFCYFYPIIARVYSLSILIIILLAVFWRQKYDRPIVYGILIGLLFQTHIILSGLAIGLTLCMMAGCLKKEQRTKQQVIGTIIPLSSLFLMILELYHSADSPASVSVSVESIVKNIKTDLTAKVSSVFISRFPSVNYERLVFSLVIAFTILAVALLIFLFFVIWKRYPYLLGAFIASACGVSATVIIIVFIYAGTSIMKMMLLVEMLFAVWTMCIDSKNAKFKILLLCTLSVISLVTVIPWINYVRFDINEGFSGSKEASTFIRDNLPEGSVILLGYNECNTPVCAYVDSYRKDIMLFDINTGEPYICYVWKKGYPEKTLPEIEKYASDTFPDGKNIFYLLSYDNINDVDIDENYDAVFMSDKMQEKREKYVLYRIK